MTPVQGIILALLLTSITPVFSQKVKRTPEEKLLRQVESFFDIGPREHDASATWYCPRLAETSNTKDACYLFFAKEDSIASRLTMRIQYRSRVRMAKQKYIAILDGAPYVIFQSPALQNTDRKDYKFDWIEVQLNSDHTAFLNMLESTNDASIKMVGASQSISERIPSTDLKTMRRVYEYYLLFHGELPDPMVQK